MCRRSSAEAFAGYASILFFFFSVMRAFSFLTLSLFTLSLTACNNEVQDTKSATTESFTQEKQKKTDSVVVSSISIDDHHAGEKNVQPHDDAPAASEHTDNTDEPAHGHVSSHDDSNEPPHRH